MIDLHSHILPYLDDGAESMEESVEMARVAEKDGIKKMVTTPHLFRGNFIHDDLNVIKEKREELIRALHEKNINLDILPGAEVHISHNLVEKIRKNRSMLVLNQSSYMFVEFPSDHVFAGAKNLFFELMSEGITPIIAHPERNSVFNRSPHLLYELIEMGGFAQINSGSFLGLYGRRAKEAALHFLKLDLIHFIASDCHNAKSVRPRLSEAFKTVEMICGEKSAYALVNDNPRAVINDEELPYRPEPVNPMKKSFKMKIPKIFNFK